MTMRVTMRKEAFGPDRAFYPVGSIQTVADDVGAGWVAAGMALDTDGVLTPPKDSWNSADTREGVALVSEDVIVARTRTWATLPAPAAYIGQIYVTDVGLSGSLWRSDGMNWGLVNGSVVLARGNTDLTVTAASTSEEDLISIPIPAGLMGANGQLVVTHFWEMTNSANNKTMRVKLGGTAFFANVQTAALIFLPPPTRIWNRNNEASQIAFAAANGNVTVSTGTAATTGTVNTTSATTLAISGQKATGAETLRLYAYSVELIRP